jgi:isoleucyl-tRNA synthetase
MSTATPTPTGTDKKLFRDVDTKVSFPKLEEDVLAFWKQEKIFQKSLKNREGQPKYTFYEGPPTANGLPGIHHVLARVFKDLFPRYKTMRGYHVPRIAGWDTHGLPVEVEVEKKLGFKGKEDIEKYGIAEFNKLCRQSVWEYVQEWERMTDRIGFWVDQENAYITYNNDYIETGWWILKRLWDDGLLFKDYKVTMHCPRCNTSLADAEVAQGYKDDVDDPSVYIRLRLQPGEAERLPFGANANRGLPVSVMVWTTTPWTLPANTAAALKADAPYVLAKPHEEDETYVVAKELAPKLFGEDGYETLGEAQGSALVGFKYQPLFDGVDSTGQLTDTSAAYRTITDEIVEMGDGTGIVHIAPAYGDLEVGRRAGLPTLFSVDLSGRVLSAFPKFNNEFFKKADPAITRDLKERGFLWKSGRIKHTYPFCWRCSTPLLFFAKDSWYIRTTRVKDELVENNKKINWYPGHIKQGRFGNWLENNVDWALSRERYWGTPLPLWQCDKTGQYECVGSVAELEQKVGRDLKDLDLHRPYVDDLTWASPFVEGGTMRRLPLVIDCWFDSGAMPYAQMHYPFEHKDDFDTDWFPADFICEAVDQTRGWFYTLHALGTLVKEQPVYKNVICLGHILDGEGQKMSKSKGNIVNPWSVLDAQGADALRWYLYTANPPGEPRRFSQDLVSESIRKFMLTLWNTYSFFVTYANLDQPDLSRSVPVSERPTIDRWLVSRLNALVRDVTVMMDKYDVTGPARAIEAFVDDLSNWYVRLNRRRFWKSESDTDKLAAYQTLHEALVTVSKLAAPFVPFVSDAIYRNLVQSLDANAPESVHLCDWPTHDAGLIDETLLRDTAVTIRVVSLGRAARSAAKLKVRQPLLEVLVKPREASDRDSLTRFKQQVMEELNVKDVVLVENGADIMSYTLKANFKLLGPKLGKQLGSLQKALGALDGNAAFASLKADGKMSVTLESGDTFELTEEEVLVEAKQKEGYAVVEEGGYTVALNKTVTPELKREGLLRDVVRSVQSARKDADFNISDKITVWYEVTKDAGGFAADLAEALSTPEAVRYVQAETLATALNAGQTSEASAFRQDVELEGAVLHLGLVKN